MSTNPYFNFFNAENEQTLYENMIIESIQIYGINMYYLPRTNENFDELYGSSTLVTFNKAYEIEMYIKSVDGFTGDGNFMSKFGLEIRDQIIFSVANKIFKELITSDNSLLIRPREGDLVYFPISKQLFEIKYTNTKAVFFQMGTLNFSDLTCELFEYSSEVFNTGIEEIDKLMKMFTQNELETNILPAIDEDTNTDISFHSDNDQIQTESNKFIEFSEKNPFSEDGTV